MTWKDNIRKAAELNLDRPLRNEALEVIENAILELSSTKECINTAKSEGERLGEYIDPEFVSQSRSMSLLKNLPIKTI